MDTDFLPYLVPGIIYLCALVFVAVRLKRVFTPFHCCLAILTAEVALCIFPLMLEGRYSHIDAPSDTAKLILWGSAVTLFGLSLFLRPPKRYALGDFVLTPRVPRLLIIAALLGVIFANAVVSFKNLGSFPMFVLSQSTDSQQIGYKDVRSGPISYLSWGAGRILGTWLLLELSVARNGLVRFFSKQAVLSTAAALGLLLNLLDGQRNPVILMMLSGLFVLSLKGFVRPLYLVCGLAIISLLFCAVGSFRHRGEKVKKLAVTSGSDTFDELCLRVVSYIEPNLLNLDNVVRLAPEPEFGAVFLSGFVPQWVLNPVMSVPDSAAVMLFENKAFAKGNTFRTAYGDFYMDFGAFGSVVAVALVFGIGVFLFNRATLDPRCMLGFLILSPCIVFIPMMNFAIGIYSVMPFLLFGLVSFRKISAKMCIHTISPGQKTASVANPDRL